MNHQFLMGKELEHAVALWAHYFRNLGFDVLPIKWGDWNQSQEVLKHLKVEGSTVYFYHGYIRWEGMRIDDSELGAV